MGKPQPPPEAALIRLAREAAGIKIPAAAASVGISTAWWSSVENGYERRSDGYRRVTGKPGVIARMASAVAVTPERLEDVGRGDAAVILREIVRLRAEAEARQDEAADDDAGSPASGGAGDPIGYLREWLEGFDALSADDQARAVDLVLRRNYGGGDDDEPSTEQRRTR